MEVALSVHGHKFWAMLSCTYQHRIHQVWPPKASKAKDTPEALWMLTSSVQHAKSMMQEINIYWLPLGAGYH